jgi:uncharacterized protein YgbK (DUF1537 family)
VNPDSLPAPRQVSAAEVRQALGDSRRVVVLDDDPTGTQTVRDLPVLTRWSIEDVRWALRQGTAGFFVLTNTRSLTPGDAAARDRQVVETCLAAAEETGARLAFASRSDSTLRGHFPLETDVIGGLLDEHGIGMDAVVLAPAYTDAGRVTIGGVHWLRSAEGLQPVAESEFAKDATFGYRSSRLADWVAEKSAGRIPAETVVELSLEDIRQGSTRSLADRLAVTHSGQVVALDAAEDDDLRAAVLAILDAERAGKSFVYRIGPSFVRARTGQDAQPPIEDQALAALIRRDARGLVVVGSHVGLTSRQLAKLGERRKTVNVELDVSTLLGESADEHIDAAVETAASALKDDLVVLSTSRSLIKGTNEAESLDIARRVSTALTTTAGRIVAARRPAYVVAKGGITSSDVATESLGIGRAWIRGSLLPGIVSLWEPVSGPAQGLPYVVFAGNVGDENSLAEVIDRMEAM